MKEIHVIRMKWEFENVPACPCCGSSLTWAKLAEWRQGVPLQFVQCPGCTLIYQNPRMTPASLQAYFNSETFIHEGGDLSAPQLGYYNYAAWEESYRATARIRLRRILAHRPGGGLLLEIGPATGVFIREAQRQGFTALGLDISASLAAQAHARTGAEIIVGAIEDTPLLPSWYDVIACFGGFSCWRDPLTALRRIRTALRPGGIFVCNVPDSGHWLPRWQGARYPEYNHASLTIVSRRTLADLFERAGLRIVRNETERQSATLGRIATYLRYPWAVKVLQKLRLMDVSFPLIVPATRFVVAEVK